jgi:hypothetical protein
MLVNQPISPIIKHLRKRYYWLLVVFPVLFGCNEKETFTTISLDTYAPLQLGKYITYRVDSLVFTQFGRQTEAHSYQVKHIVDTFFQDNQGRKTFRIYKFINDSLATGPWKSAGTYTITPLSTQIEWTEDNLRQIKLHSPARTGFSWKGNIYLASNPLDPPYNFSNDDDIQNWDYRYSELPTTFRYRSLTYSDVITVEQIDTRFNVPITIPTAFAFRNYAVDRFSKGIGLVFRQWESWEYQPNTGGSGGPYKVGFGITQWMIDHN